ncbi:MAG TPA: hypothetical protein DEB46_12200, partial [Myxococcales bacterium]|nr:hypothetical protein [Myxococcales bacterium]
MMLLRSLTILLVFLGLTMDAQAAEVSVFPVAAKGRGKRAPRKQAKGFQAKLLAALTEAGHTTKLVGGKKLVKRASRCRGKRIKGCLARAAGKVGSHVLITHVSKVKRKVYVSVHVLIDGKHVGVAGGKFGSGVASKAIALLPAVAPPEPEPEPEPEP